MTFLAWVDFSNMLFAIHKDDSAYISIKYSGGNKVLDSEKRHESKQALQEFLVSMPNAPMAYIDELIERI